MFLKENMLFLFLFVVFVPCVLGQEQVSCYGAGSVAGAAIGAFLGALLLVAAAYYLRKLYRKTRKGKHLVLSTDPENVKDEFAFDNHGFKNDEKQTAWHHDAPTLPVGGKAKPLHAEFIKPEFTKDDIHVHKPRTRRVKLWARDFTGLGLRCGGGAREGVHIHSVLRSGPAAAAKLHPGDKIKSIKIELTGTPLEDAVNILSLASPYPVELEVVEGGRISGGGRGIHHPLLKRAGSTGDVNSLEKEAKHLHPPQSPDASHSNNSTLESKHPKGIKKMITDKIMTTSLERNKKEKKDTHMTTLERENEKNTKMAKRHSDISAASVGKPEKPKSRFSTGSNVQVTQPENGYANIEHSEVQKRDYDPKRGMKFGIRVLPPNIPDDGVLKHKSVENGVIVTEKTIDETDKPQIQTQIKHEIEIEIKKPIVAKRREKIAPPIPNARTKLNDSDSSQDTPRHSASSNTSFTRNDLNSSGIKRDENGIPQELPSHMFEAARAVRNNRKSSVELINEKEKMDFKKDEAPKSSKKSKGKAPSPPEFDKNKTDDSILEQLKNVNDFLSSEKQHSSLLNDSTMLSTDRSSTSINTSTPKVNKTKYRMDDSINFTPDDIYDIVTKPFKRESDSLNNFYDDSKSQLSSNQDIHSVVSLNTSDKSEKGSTTIELNNSDITIHSSPLNETLHSSNETSVVDDNERKAASLGDLSRFELKAKSSQTSTGTLERAQSLDISGEDTDTKQNTLSPKKGKAMSIVESTFYDSNSNDPEIVTERITIKHKEPRLSLQTTAMDGLNTFQRNRLKKGSEFGNLEDAIVKSSNSSIESDKDIDRHPRKEFDLSKIDEPHESSDHLAKRIMDENLKVHYKLVSEFAKSTSDGSNISSLDSTQEEQRTSPVKPETSPSKHEEKMTLTYDTNIPDDMKVSRNSYVNSLERPKSDMMKKLLAKNPILVSSQVETTETNKAAQPDIVNFDLKTSPTNKDYDDYVSNIRVGSNDNSLKYPKSGTFSAQWTEVTPPEKSNSNIVTITTEKTMSPEPKSYTKSIEIGEPTVKLIPDVIEGIQKRSNDKERTLYMEPGNVAITMTQEPVQKSVTVNVAEDEYGNKVITQKVQEVSKNYTALKSEAPLEIEQISFGIMKNPGDINEEALEDGNIKYIERKILEDINKQNKNMYFTSVEPSYTETETIFVTTNLDDEEEAVALMEKIKNDPKFMSQKTPEELSKLGIKVIHDLEDVKNETIDKIEVTKTRYTINPALATDGKKCLKETQNNEHITEIQVVTPKTQKQIDKIASRQRQPPNEEPPLSYELDIELLNDFIANERHHSAKQQQEIKKKEPKKHSDYNLPRNSQIMFRTATYESPKGTIVTSTDLENRRLSQLDQMQLRSTENLVKPSISAKPSNIPVKTPEKSKTPTNVSSKIPVFMSQRSLSQENVLEISNVPLSKSPPPNLSSSSGNISVTSIKSSSKHPSGL